MNSCRDIIETTTTKNQIETINVRFTVTGIFVMKLILCQKIKQ